MVVLLVMQLVVLRDSREHIVAQDRKVNRLLKGTDPALDELRPVLRALGPALDDARPALDDLGPALESLPPALDELRPAAAEARRTLREAPPLVGELLPLADLGTQLIRGLRDSEFVPRTLRAADLVPEMAGILHATLDVQRQTLSVQRETLAIQRASLRAQRRSLRVQEESLVHIRSIDRKTGGPAPAAPAAPLGGGR